MQRLLLALICLAFGFAGGWYGHARWHLPPFHHHPFGPGHGPGDFPPPPPPDGGPGPLDHLLDDAQASPEQRQLIHAIDERHQPELAKLRTEIDGKRKAFEDAQGGDVDDAELKRRFFALLDAKREGELGFFALVSEVRGALTKEQRQRIEAARRAHGFGPPHGD